jgi:hypothetical protein
MEDDNFRIPCFEEDLENMSAEELDNFYSILNKGNVIDLNWKCVGEYLNCLELMNYYKFLIGFR